MNLKLDFLKKQQISKMAKNSETWELGLFWHEINKFEVRFLKKKKFQKGRFFFFFFLEI